MLLTAYESLMCAVILLISLPRRSQTIIHTVFLSFPMVPLSNECRDANYFHLHSSDQLVTKYDCIEAVTHQSPHCHSNRMRKYYSHEIMLQFLDQFQT